MRPLTNVNLRTHVERVEQYCRISRAQPGQKSLYQRALLTQFVFGQCCNSANASTGATGELGYFCKVREGVLWGYFQILIIYPENKCCTNPASHFPTPDIAVKQYLSWID